MAVVGCFLGDIPYPTLGCGSLGLLSFNVVSCLVLCLDTIEYTNKDSVLPSFDASDLSLFPIT